MIPGQQPEGDNIVLIGPMGAGKSSIARELSRLTSRRWTDTDKEISRRTGRTVSEIFDGSGEEFFRCLERETLRALTGEQRLIIATGGGIVTLAENIPLLRALGCVVFLSADEEVLFERVSRNRNRPLLQTADPRATLGELVRARRGLYEKCAHATVDTSHGTHAGIAQTVLAAARRFFAETGQTSALP